MLLLYGVNHYPTEYVNVSYTIVMSGRSSPRICTVLVRSRSQPDHIFNKIFVFNNEKKKKWRSDRAAWRFPVNY
jgi:hypothetical protein